MRCSGTCRKISAPKLSAKMSPASSGMISMGTVSGIAKKKPVAMGAIVPPFGVRAEIRD
jgi:hypothetical protein